MNAETAEFAENVARPFRVAFDAACQARAAS